MAIKLIVSDLDGTLLPRSGRLGSRTREVIAEARRRGIRFTLATGRLFHSALPIAAELGLETPVICCDGALTRDALRGEVTRELILPRETAREIFAQLFFYADHLFLLGNDVIYAAPDADEFMASSWGGRCIRFDPAEPLPDGLQAILAFGQPELLAQAAKLVEDDFADVEAVPVKDRRGGSRPLLVRPRGADKGAALAALRHDLGLKPAEVMVFGDWPNDLPMFGQAGYAVAPRDAHPAVKCAARYVSGYTSEEECVAREVERVILRSLTKSRKTLARSG